MKRFDGKKTVRLVVSLLVAIGIWIYVGIIDPVDMTVKVKGVPVVFVGEDTALADKGLMVVNSSASEIDLTLLAQRKVFWDFDTEDVRLLVDLREIEDVGTYTLSYTVEYPGNVQKSRITVDEASLYSVTVEIGELYKKTVEVQYEVTGSVPTGYLLQPSSLETTSLVIHGQQADVMRVSYAKISYDVTGCTNSVNEMVAPKYYGSDNQLLEDVTIYSNKKTLPVNIPIYMVKELPLTVELTEAAGIRADSVSVVIQPEKLTFAGEYYLMEELESFGVGTIDLASLSANTGLMMPLTLPDGMIVIDGTENVMVSVTMKDVTTRSFSVSNLSIANLSDGLTAELETSELTILLRGRETDLNAVSVSEIQIAADLSGVQNPGVHTVPAIVRYAGSADVGIIGSYELSVTVK